MIITNLEIIVAIAVVYAGLVILVQRRLGNVDKMYEIRARMSSSQKHLMQLIKDNAPKETISEKQRELMGISTESMKLQFKPMLVVLPMFLLLYYVILPMKFNMGLNVTVLTYTVSYHFFFVALLFVVGLLFSILFSVYDRRRLRGKYKFGLMQPSFIEEPTDT